MQQIYQFDNGYGASVIDDGYGSKAGLEEMALLHGNVLCYKPDVLEHDVLGWLTPAEVAEKLGEIAALPPNPVCNHREKR